MENPGEYPFTRGIYPLMYKKQLWTMRQYAGFSSAEESNQRYLYLLRQGQTGLSIAFDLPTQIGYDSNHPLARAEVGKVGVPIDTLKDMEILFQGIPLDQASTSMTINATAPILLAMYIALAKKNKVPSEKLRGTVQNDILKEYVARGTYIFPIKPSVRLATDLIEYCSRYLPQWNTASISGYHMREAGCSAVQEVAFTLANGIAYVQAALDKGLDVDVFAQRLSFFFASHTNFLEEVAKFRAARRLWAKIMKERFKAKDDRSCMLRFHAQTCGHTLTREQPLNNISRITLQALAAVLGGAQSLHTNSYDEAYATPSEEAVTIALRTQQIIARETGIIDYPDALGGSYSLESLTDSLGEQAQKYIAKIDEMGGAASAIENGFIQREIQESSYNAQKEIEEKKKIVVGLNEFQSPYQKIGRLTKVDSGAREKQIKLLLQIKKERNQQKTKLALNHLKAVAETNENTMPAFIECAENYATIGEICNVLRKFFGEYKENCWKEGAGNG
ncbi:MAG: methylmalonyl-CoA mutase [Candidatus Nealsonbacteria bacterium]|nr:methylmalonyl-CoA mutase [Candidatus Nealsonbacteria bacterium]